MRVDAFLQGDTHHDEELQNANMTELDEYSSQTSLYLIGEDVDGMPAL